MAQKSTIKDKPVLPPCSDEQDGSTDYWEENQGILLMAHREGKLRIFESSKGYPPRNIKTIACYSSGKIEIFLQ